MTENRVHPSPCSGKVGGSQRAYDAATPSLRNELEPPPGGLDRLLVEVSRAPRRYAPFYDDLRELFQVEEAQLEHELGKTTFYPTLLPGARMRRVALGPSLAHCRGYLTRFAPGLRFPRHSHRGTERFLVLEGGFVDDTGRRYVAGDMCIMQPGSEHAIEIDNDGVCVSALVLTAPLSFQSPVLRILSRLFEW
ncbi:MAG: cupin domain-containing protein [Myxococcales bacterium]|nr:cupin domain-containing protein [Myxococcales bacterium]